MVSQTRKVEHFELVNMESIFGYVGCTTALYLPSSAGSAVVCWLLPTVSEPHTPARDQIRTRRWAVDFDIPKHGGRLPGTAAH